MNRPLPLLSFYLMQAFQSWGSAQGALPYLFDTTIDIGEGFNSWPETLRQLNQTDQRVFAQHVYQEISQRWQRFSKGILNYMSHLGCADRLSAQCVWQKGTTKVWSYAPEFPAYPIILIIPSLINKFYIFDLDKECSFIQSLKDQKLCPWVIDWQNPGPEESAFSIEDYVEQRILPILAQAYCFQQRKVSVLGYCMGGILSLAAAHMEQTTHQSFIDHLILLATPWDFEPTMFHHHLPPLVSFFEEWNISLNYFPPLPKEIVQSYFDCRSPQKILEKFDVFSQIDSYNLESKRMFQIEEWANDGVSLNAPLAFSCFQEWCTENKLAKKQIYLKNQCFDLQKITTPVLLINGEKDTIVPLNSSKPLTKLVKNCHFESFPLGHVGLIVGKKAPELSWKFIHHWLQSNNYF